MIIKIRNGVFETNSSSVHAVALVPREDIENWLAGNIAIAGDLDDPDKIYTRSSVTEKSDRDIHLHEQFGYIYDDAPCFLTGWLLREDCEQWDENAMQGAAHFDRSKMKISIDAEAYKRGDSKITVTYDDND